MKECKYCGDLVEESKYRSHIRNVHQKKVVVHYKIDDVKLEIFKDKVSSKWICRCGKEYASPVALHKHANICVVPNQEGNLNLTGSMRLYKNRRVTSDQIVEVEQGILFINSSRKHVCKIYYP